MIRPLLALLQDSMFITYSFKYRPLYSNEKSTQRPA